ncbi:hypothetical protein, variant [Puccinia graminis f. sp. tritici CRL 75-36-700-3]|nr:hypothetical protein, variant [Puccinia graminis f. sp. tritici CRL 75-36-700-3]EHS64267.1 hypothetical protein, variant [Puccinia graminis f. sp. tritici CRL 75-36-700-3]
MCWASARRPRGVAGGHETRAVDNQRSAAVFPPPTTPHDRLAPQAQQNNPIDPMADPQVLSMPTKWVCLIDGGQDDDFEGFFSLIEQFTGRKMVPVPAHMLQLIGLVVHPMFCLRSHVPASHADPIVVSGKKVAGRAWSFLDLFLKTSGPDNFLRCLPGYNNSKSADLEVIPKESFKNQDHQPIVRRLIDASNIWEILLTFDESSKQTISPGAWDLLDLLITAWEIDFKNQGVPEIQTENSKGSTTKGGKICFPHFLRQLGDAPAEGFRIDSRVYDIIFEPFGRNSASPDYSWGCATNSLARAQELSIRLLHLLDRLDGIQLLEPGRLREDIVIRMLGLETTDLHVFVNILPADHLLRTRLLSRFLESVTRSVPTALTGFALSNSQSSTVSLSPGRSGLTRSTSATGLRRTPSRTALKFDDRHPQSSILNSKPQVISLSSLITQLLPRPLLDIPATTTRQSSASSKLDPTVLVNAESRYFSVLSVILGSLLAIHQSKTGSEIDQDGLSLVKQGKLRSAIQTVFDSVTEALGDKLDSLDDQKTFRTLLHRKVNRTIKAFEHLASKS